MLIIMSERRYREEIKKLRVEALELGYKAGFHSGMAKGYEYGFHEGILGDKNKGIIIGSKVDADVKQVLKDKGFF